MDKNLFIVNASTDENIDLSTIEPGYILIDCNADVAWNRVSSTTSVHDDTNDRDIINSEFVYLPQFPSDCITYEEMVAYGKEKYYWDALHQFLYRFVVTDTVKPFVVPSKQVIVGCEGNPAVVIATSGEFSKLQGVWNEVTVEGSVSSYIEVGGHPSMYAEMPYQENTYYYDYVHDLWYTFTSYYTLNINNWYYDRTVLNSQLLKFNEDINNWDTVGNILNVSGNPNDLIKIIDTEDNSGSINMSNNIPIDTEITVDIDNIDKNIYYSDSTTNTLYEFDYGQYFIQISFTGTVYERAFNFYRELQDVFAGVNENTIVPTKDIYYVGNHPRKSIKSPDTGRVYYDSKNQKFYTYTNNDWVEITQTNVFVPQSLFPHSHGEIKKSVI